MEFAIMLWVVCAILGALLAEARGHDRVMGFLLGLILGVFGLAWVALMRNRKEEVEVLLAAARIEDEKYTA